MKSNGYDICQDIADTIENVHMMGHDEGDVEFGPVTVKLWHGEDGSTYAFSYRIQKIVESLTGGEKPDVLLAGHCHKALYVFDRNIHCISCGAIQKQSRWMRSKRHASHTGFWVVRMTVHEKGVGSFTSTWYPYYV